MARWWAIGWRSPPLWVSHWLSPLVLRPESGQSFIWLPALSHTHYLCSLYTLIRSHLWMSVQEMQSHDQNRVMLFVSTGTTDRPPLVFFLFPFSLSPDSTIRLHHYPWLITSLLLLLSFHLSPADFLLDNFLSQSLVPLGSKARWFCCRTPVFHLPADSTSFYFNPWLALTLACYFTSSIFNDIALSSMPLVVVATGRLRWSTHIPW